MPISSGYWSLAGGIAVHLVLGTLYCWANVTLYVTSFLRSKNCDPNALETCTITYDSTLNIYALELFFQGTMMFLGGYLRTLTDTRFSVSLGGSLIVIGIFLASFCTSISGFFVTQGILFGLGVGLCYTSPILCTVEWFPEKKSLISGSIVAGFGGGAFLFGILAIKLVNPWGFNVAQSGPNKGYYDFDSPVIQRVPFMYRMLALCYLVLLIFGVFALRDRRKEPFSLVGFIRKYSNRGYSSIEHNESEHGASFRIEDSCDVRNDTEMSVYRQRRSENELSKSEEQDECRTAFKSEPLPCSSEDNLMDDSASAKKSDSNSVDMNTLLNLTPTELCVSSLAWHVAFCFVATAVGGMYIAGTFKTFATTALQLDKDGRFAGLTKEEILSYIASISSIFNAIGRIFWGYVGDRYGPLNVLMIMSVLFAVIIFCIPCSAEWGVFPLASFIFLLFFFEGCNFALYVPLVIQIFGNVYASSNYGLIFSVYSVFVMINIVVLSKYHIPFPWAAEVLSLVTLLGFFLLVWLKRRLQSLSSSG